MLKEAPMNNLIPNKLSEDYFKSLEKRVVQETLLLNYESLLNELEKNFKEFTGDIDYSEFKEKVKREREAFKPLEFEYPISKTYFIDYEEGSVNIAIAKDFTFTYDNKDHILYVDSYTTEVIKRII